MSRALPFRLSPPREGRVDLLVIAAEHSGDQHAGRMVAGLLAIEPDRRVAALGGPALQAAGAQLLEDLTVHSTMGFAVFGRLSFYRALMAEVVRWVKEHQPRAVCLVDSSGLNLRIARKLHAQGLAAKAGGATRLLYYISPQVWASRARRRFQMAAHLDGLAAIFPFEKEIYSDTDLPVTFVGHPFVSPDYQAPVAFDPAGPVLLLPGSRQRLVKRLLPVMLQAFARAGGDRPAAILYPSDAIKDLLESFDLPSSVTLCPAGKGGAVAGSAVLTSSGTMSMHCALAGIPGAVTYRIDPLTYWLGRMIVKVKHIGIANLLLAQPMYPEYIQGAATAEALAGELADALTNAKRRHRTGQLAARLRTLLSAPIDGSAAQWLRRRLD